MRKLIMLFLFLICFSCNKEKYTTNKIFLENLKETSSFYEEQTKKISEAINSKYQDFSYKSGKYDTLNMISKKLDVLFIDLKKKSKQEKITIQSKFIDEINNLNFEYKLNSVSTEKLQVLDDEMIYYYLKTEFYKNQFDNYTKHYSKIGVYCGSKSSQ